MMEKKTVREQVPRAKRNSKTTSIEFTSNELKVLIVACTLGGTKSKKRIQTRVLDKLRTSFLALELYP